MDNSYTELKGCHNCGMCFIKAEYDESTTYYCTLDAPERPLCGSVYMDEYDKEKGYGFDWEAWDKWKEGREVKAWGFCNKHAIIF